MSTPRALRKNRPESPKQKSARLFVEELQGYPEKKHARAMTDLACAMNTIELMTHWSLMDFQDRLDLKQIILDLQEIRGELKQIRNEHLKGQR